MQRQDSNNTSRRVADGAASAPSQNSGPGGRFLSESFVNSVVDAAAKAGADEKRRQPQNAERVYQACLPCKKRKTKCVRGDETNPDVLPCARCRRQGKVAECVLAPRGPWPVGDSRRPKEYRALHRTGTLQAKGSPAMRLNNDCSPSDEVVDGGAWEDYLRPPRPELPAFTTSASGSAALDQLMSNVQDLRHAAPTVELDEYTKEYSHGPPNFDTSDGGLSGDYTQLQYDLNDCSTIWKLSPSERNSIPLAQARSMPNPVGLYTWDLRDWGGDDEEMVVRELAKRPYESACEARYLRNNRGMRPADADALNMACYELDKRQGKEWAWKTPSRKPGTLPRQGREPTSRTRNPSTATYPTDRADKTGSSSRVSAHPSRRPPEAVSSSRPAPSVRSDDTGPPHPNDDEEEDEVKLRLRILAVEKEELELQLRLHRLRGAKRRRLNSVCRE